jgi:cytochrome c551
MPRRLLALLLPLGLLLACAEKSYDDDDDDDAEDSAVVEGDDDEDVDPDAVGATAYATHCVACHGSEGEGGVGPAHSDVIPGLEATDLERILDEGRGTMPPIFVPEEERGPLVAYVLDTFG